VRRTRADRIDDLLLIAERGVEAAERIAACIEKGTGRPSKRRRKAKPKNQRRSG
jgi:hypothetical protein